MPDPAHPRRGPAFAVGFILLGLTLGSQFVVATYGDVPEPPPVRTAELPEADRGRVRLVDGFPVIHLAGTPYEMGRQHGVVLRRQIRFLYSQYYEAMVVRLVGEDALDEWAKSVEPYLPAHIKEELKGIAGCGLSYEQILRCNVMIDRFQTVLCSTVVAANEATKDNDVLFGRNLDFPGRALLHKMTVVIVWQPKDGTPLAAVTWPGIVGVLSGMNGHGVAGATMLVLHGGVAKPGLPYTIMYREALSRARNVDDVYEFIAKAKRTCANNFMVCDATGKAQVVEFSTDVAARRSAEADCICSTNFFRTEELRDVGWGRHSHGRYETLAEFLETERGKIDVERVKKALGDVARPAEMNVQSMIFMPRKRALHVSRGGKLPAAKQPFVFLDAELLFGAKR